MTQLAFSGFRRRFQRLMVLVGSGLGLLAWAPCSLAEEVPHVKFNPAEMLRNKSCQIYQDDQKISHIRVLPNPNLTSDELMTVGIACMGLVHAQERGWEMDFFRRTMQGRRAEVFGFESIRSDFFFRLLGLAERAERLYEQMPENYKQLLLAYTWGVNRGLKAQGSYEFEQMGYAPEPWSPQDSLGIILLQSFDQTRRSFQTQFDQRMWVEEYGALSSELFSAKGLPWDVTILKSGEYPVRASSQKSLKSALNFNNLPTKSNSLDADSSKTLGALQNYFNGISSLWDGPGVGSNNWVLDPSRSKTGNAWMANDPHLNLTRPLFWHWASLEVPGGVHVIGATLPGVPVFVIGTNMHVSWGVTNSFLPAARVSLVPTKELEVTKATRPTVWFKFWKFKLPMFFKTYQRTPKGLPVLPIESPEGMSTVLRWTGFDMEAGDLVRLTELLRARNVNEVDTILSHVRVPSWNFVFADDLGKIGYRAMGRIMRLEGATPYGIARTSLDAVENSKDFSDPLKADEMPHVLNPKRGFVATANNQQWPEDSEWRSGNAHALGFRAYRIEELLQKTERHDLESIRRVQCDVQAVDARFLMPEILKLLASEPDSIPIQALRRWNFETDLKCTACAIYRRLLDHVDADLGLNTTAFFRRLRLSNEIQAEDGAFRAAVLNSYRNALEDLGYTKNNVLPAWGSVHLNYFHHFAQVPTGKSWFVEEPIQTPGDDETVNPGTSHWNGKVFDHTAGASQRLIVEMSSPPKVYAILPGSNQDRIEGDYPKSVQKWASCELERRNFPLDWHAISQTAVKIDTIEF